MTAILAQMSVAIGGLMFIVSLVIMLTRGVPILVAVFRASVVMCVTSTVVAMFLRYFSSILRRFVAEQVMKRSSEAAEAAGRRHLTGAAPQAGGTQRQDEAR